MAVGEGDEINDLGQASNGRKAPVLLRAAPRKSRPRPCKSLKNRWEIPLGTLKGRPNPLISVGILRAAEALRG